MKTLLINPPWYSLEGRKAPTFSLGIAYIAAVLRKAGHDVHLIDADGEGIGWEELERRVRHIDPEFVGITSATVTFNSALRAARIAKRVNPKVYVSIGGPHVSALPAETLKENPDLDFVIKGEGEETSRELVEHLEKGKPLEGILGLYYRKGKSIKQNADRPPIEDLDSIPFPARDLLPMKQVDRTLWGHPAGHILSSRGCPNMCVFCASHLIFGKRARFRSAKNVVDEIEELVKVYDVHRFGFSDDTFTLRPERVSEICRDIKRRKLDVKWVCQARVNTITREMLMEMKDAGCVEIDFGVESGDPEVLIKMRKGITIDQVRKAIKITNEVGIKTLAYYIIGTPFDTKRSTKMTIDLAKELNAYHSYFNILVPYPGTEIYYNAQKTDSIGFTTWSDFHQAKSIIKVQLSNEYIESALKKAKRDLFLHEFKNKVKQGNLAEVLRDVMRGGGYIRRRAGL